MINNSIEKIKNGTDIELFFDYVIENLYKSGPISTSLLEIITYLKIFQSERFKDFEDDILELMGVFYKNANSNSLSTQIFRIYQEYIRETFGRPYTPLQANIIKKIHENQIFSFSAPTSTGKSFTFRYLVKNAQKDVVIIVPSRALINEYYDRINSIITDKTVNVLTFVEKINIKHTKRNIFIITPERCREIFKQKQSFEIELVLFDEAQLSNENSPRGLYFDSIVRRMANAYPEAKFVFAHPFIENPEAQIEKNKFVIESQDATTYKQKNVGQIFVAHEDNDFCFFGIDKSIMGMTKVPVEFDPIKKSIENSGSVLVYTIKASIYSREVFRVFDKYIALCSKITDEAAIDLINEIKKFIGASNGENTEYISKMIEMLKVGVVVHHGSMPLRARYLLERFTQLGHCKICFATSTLEQGINMPFEVVYVNTFEESEPLGIKNLIGRAGRSTSKGVFDYGYVVVKSSNMSSLRRVMNKSEIIDNVSNLDKDDNNEDYKEFTNAEVGRLNDVGINKIVEQILGILFSGGTLMPLEQIRDDVREQKDLYDGFERLYEQYLGGRKLEDGEKYVLDTAIKIMLWQIHQKNFKIICNYRYAYATEKKQRRALENAIKNPDNIDLYKRKLNSLPAHFFTGYSDLQNKSLKVYSLFGYAKASDIDYDRIVFDTYDFLDKLIGFKLSDIYYAVFYQYFLRNGSELSLKMAKYVKYGTDDEQEIWMLKYGFTFEDMEWLKPCVDKIDENEIVFNKMIENLSLLQNEIISRYIH